MTNEIQTTDFNADLHLTRHLGAVALPTGKIAIVIPSTINHVIPQWANVGVLPSKYALAAPSEYLTAIRKSVYALFGQFGGFTNNEQFGGWISDDNSVILERGELVWSYANPTRENVDNLVQLAQSIKALLVQDNILIIVNDRPYLI